MGGCSRKESLVDLLAQKEDIHTLYHFKVSALEDHTSAVSLKNSRREVYHYANAN